MLKVLYLSHNGMTEPLGRSQVMGYVLGIARRQRVRFWVVSFEPHDASEADMARVATDFDAAGVTWLPLRRSPSHSMLRKGLELGHAFARCVQVALRERPQVVHARSYVPAAALDLVALACPSAKLLFDCRGMLGDEYVEGGHWTRDRLEYRLLKRFEARFFRRSDAVVMLTENLAELATRERWLGARTLLGVVPCCADEERFRPDETWRLEVRAELGVRPDEPLLVYGGSLGLTYCEPSMARFVELLVARGLAPRLLLLTRSPSEALQGRLRAAGVQPIVRRASPQEMPRYLAAADAGLSFITPCFSKRGSSPTKVAEYLAAGLIAVVNAGVGDQDRLDDGTGGTLLLPDLDEASLQRGAAQLERALARPRAERVAGALACFERHFSLQRVGVPRYEALYAALAR